MPEIAWKILPTENCSWSCQLSSCVSHCCGVYWVTCSNLRKKNLDLYFQIRLKNIHNSTHIFSNIKWPFSVEFRRISDISGTRNRISGYTCEVKWKLYSLTWLFSSFFQSNFWHIWRFFKNFALPLQYAKYFGKNSTTNSCLYSFLQGKHIQNPKIKFWVTPRSHTKKRIATDFGFV